MALFWRALLDETAGVPIKEFAALKPKMYSYLVDDSGEYKQATDVNKNVAVRTTHNEYRDLLRHSMNRIQRKNKIGTYEINKIFLSYFNYKTYIQSHGYDGLALGYHS